MKIPTYLEQLTEAMTWLGEQPDTLFLGQQVLYPGNAIYTTLAGVPDAKKVELPVAEDMQLGMTIGLALDGYVPVSIFPRMDFLMLAMNQLANHLDKIRQMSHGEFNPKVIIRTAIGATTPLYPGPQHCSDYTEGLDAMLSNVSVVKMTDAADILPSYLGAYASQTSRILVEVADLYGEV